MNTLTASCSHCLLPVRSYRQEREINGETHVFCCYGCCLAFQMHHGDHEEPVAAGLLIRLGIGAFLAMNIMLFSLMLYSGTAGPADSALVQGVHALLWALATPVLIILGGPFICSAWREAHQGRVNADTLVSLGVLAAYGYSAFAVVTGGPHVYFDTATMVLVLFTLGRYLEALGRVRTARSLAPVLAAQRASATVITQKGDIEMPAANIATGTLVRIHPGERIPVDGIVVEGHSTCDEAVLTGQSEPHKKHIDSPVHAGSLNGTGHLLVRATTNGSDTRWMHISRLVREALSRKSTVGELIDGAAAVFVPAVVVLAIATIGYWYGQATFDAALMAGLAVLVVACPCALGLAAPLATALGLGQAAQHGIVVRGGAVFERLARIRAIAFDKTGTLTSGEPNLAGVFTAGVSENTLLEYAVALARGSSHALALGTVRAAQAQKVNGIAAKNLEERPGEGLIGEIAGASAAIGSASFMKSLGWSVPPALSAAAADGEETGCSHVFVGWAGEVRGLLLFSDTPLPEARSLVAALSESGIGTCLISGDSPAATARIAARLGIDAWHGGVLPEEKVKIVRDWGRARGPIAMVGDGLNDGPVLASATVGIAVGGATDLARESADIALPAGALRNLPGLLQLARRVRTTILMNLAWALGYNMVALALAAAGLLVPVIAAALMAGSSLLVVMNSLRVTHGHGRRPNDTTMDANDAAVSAGL